MIYLDNAATSYPKPDAVAQAVYKAIKYTGGSAGRGGYASSRAISEKIFECRESLCGLIGAKDPSRIIFTKNATEAINVVMSSFSHCEIIISSMEHNAVYRSAIAAGMRGAKIKIAQADAFGRVSPEAVASLITPRTRLVCVLHASNIVGTVNDIAAIGEICKRRKVAFLTDCAQSGGVIDIDASCADFVVLAGHKGLFGPQGTGVLYIGEDQKIAPFEYGGTGSNSASPYMPDSLPDRFEAGTQNFHAIAGLHEGVRFAVREGIAEKEDYLYDRLLSGLSVIRGVKVLGGGRRTAVAGIKLSSHDCVEVASILDRDYDIAVRAGLQCAPLAHKSIGTFDNGLLRVSPGFFNTESEIDAFLYALDKILK